MLRVLLFIVLIILVLITFSSGTITVQASHTAYMSTDAAALAAITVPGIVSEPFVLGSYVSGGSGLSGSSPANAWAWVGDAVFDPTAANALDHRWVQSINTPVIWDLGSLSSSVLVFPSIDHGPMSPAPYEALEFTVWGSNLPTAIFPAAWTLATLTTVYADGWIDVGALQESDDFASLWSFGASEFQFIAVHANRSMEIAPENAEENWCAGEGVWCSHDHEIDAVASPAEPPCPLNAIQVDVSLSNNVVSGNASGLPPCEAVIEIHNDRGYWVNYRVSTGGGVTITPAGGDNNFYDFNKILAPNESVRYLATFSEPNQTVTAFLDVTIETGQGAKLMNLVQAEVDLISLLVPGFGTGFKIGVEFYPDIVNAFGAMPHLSNAADALFSNPPKIGTFMRELLRAGLAGEYNTLGSTLEELGLEGSIEAFKLLLKEPGRVFSVIDVIRRNYGNVFSLLFNYPAGSIIFVSE